jgi:simple sugar transport system ATP-binding protein
MSLLDLNDIRKHFGPVQVLLGVDLKIDAGEVVALVGDNGAGKSTLMKIITGIHKPDGGTIHFDGADISGHSPGEIRERGIEMIYQDLALARMQDVASNIFLGREPTRRFLGTPIRMIDRPRIEREAAAMIQKLGARVPSVRHIVGQLSGGQQQSVAIARALTFNPKLVIMDEPTAALAVREVEHVLELIGELKNHRVAVILISHRLPDVFAVCSRIITLRQGRVIADEPAARTTMSNVVAHIVGAD